MQSIVVATFYRFVELDDIGQLRGQIAEQMRAAGVRGTVLLAPEGINATIAGPREGIDAVLGWLKQDSRFHDLRHRESITGAMPFRRIKIKLRNEIVTMGIAGVDAAKQSGTYVQPSEWNALISDPDVTLIDARNHYEVETGTFRNAVDPHTSNFREFPRYAQENLDPRRHRKIAMFCTGGIRCEKATALLKQRGFDEVYHLYGGVLNYLAEIPRAESLWDGECFVFDDRVTVDHNLDPGQYDQCHACRMPISEQDKKSADYQPGVSCPRCINTTTPEQRAGFAERIKQAKLAEKRGTTHLGPNDTSQE